mmetsp:Transcript_1179/g.1384  ORF Transcript_1179/g.1384 Transcript_1179/m.1384 type:complete len:124 (+) Transcript_1179:215-586(+)|eukprot:CAMPEP_0197849178 /NCGR_PEP_ID=MMETSP1438-20131217/11159_1 /TAXON_ID=1461541 /ORGANISM="Pterosperma sp., Strain CCMP1384" /LENGTH=123 /DNA_ID=CAMNT_0043461739 /DNA_START=215 /DNA_END=586 /DNA_ORIENTATION=+
MADEEDEQHKGPKGPNLDAHKIQVVQSYMKTDYERQAIEVCCLAVEKFKNSKDMATFVKKEYDKRFPSNGKATDGVYHCITGTHFGASVSHETAAFAHIKIDLVNFILFKSKDSPFDVDSAQI